MNSRKFVTGRGQAWHTQWSELHG